MIIKATVVETDNVFTQEGNKNSIWCYRYLDHQHDYVAIPNGKTVEGGWNDYDKTKDLSVLKDMKQCSQFLWLDETTFGHGISLGDECYLTLSEAMKYVEPSRKKHLKRRLNKFRSRSNRFIASTWEEPYQLAEYAQTHPGFKKLPMKKVYVKRK